jgi:hypothetical protein
VQNIDEILKVPGIDMLIIAPFDLSTTMGYANQRDHPEVVRTITMVEEKVLQSRIPLAGVALSLGSSSLLVNKAHQESIQDIFTGIRSDLLMCVDSSAIPESPNVRMIRVPIIKNTFAHIASLLEISLKFHFIAENTNAMRETLELLHLRDTSRCASRGLIRPWQPLSKNIRRSIRPRSSGCLAIWRRV